MAPMTSRLFTAVTNTQSKEKQACRPVLPYQRLPVPMDTSLLDYEHVEANMGIFQ